MRTATFVRPLETPHNTGGTRALYRMSPPHEGNEYVVCSGVNWAYAHECYLFAANAAGDVEDWCELPGSIRDTTDHAVAMREAGYEIVGVQ